MDLSGKNILLTGASRGIGEALARSLAGAGARVSVHYSKSAEKAERLADELGNGARAFSAELSNPIETIKLFENVVKEFGSVDVLINNAGVAIHSPVDNSDEDWLADWHSTMNVNLTAMALLCRKTLGHFEERGGGRIINIASRASFRGDTPEYLAYAASKGGVIPFTRSIARYYGKKGVKAFVVAPGFVRTDMAQDFMDEYGEDFALNDIALPNLTTPSDIAPLVTFLASGLADHATGGTFDVNAGSYVH
ncbi:MAG: SDR family oxidoreductase [Flavobacteriales bacterium]|nr:SDR family oxidoreductase [Flavobacteriales bacterium]